MKQENSIPIFIDNCVVSLGETMQSIFKKEKVIIDEKSFTLQILGYERKPSFSSNQQWKLHQINCLPKIGKIARENKIKLFTYNELMHEAWKRPNSFPSNALGNIFSDVKFEHVDAAVARSFFFQTEISEYISNEQMIKFCKWILNPNTEKLAERIKNNTRYPAFLIQNLRNIQRFRELCHSLSERQYIDAFHLWTAEVNNAKYFLTTDKKFIRVMTQTKNIELPCKPTSPSRLLEILEISDLEPFKYSRNQFYTIFGKSI